jgi:hypothetical protein
VGLFDVDNMIYVGKVYDGFNNKPAAVQVSQPGAGIYITKSGAPLFIESGGYFLVNNPNYTYYWVDSSINDNIPSNSVNVKLGGPDSFTLNVGRLQQNGQIYTGLTGPGYGLFYSAPNIAEHLAYNYQVLVCDPKPSNPCSKFNITFIFKNYFTF